MTIDPARLTQNDIGRNVLYHREYSTPEVGRLSSWNEHYVFVQFKGPNGEACDPEDVSFEYEKNSNKQ